MPSRNPWSRRELLVAGYLYCRIPFGRFHQHNPALIEFAEKLGRTPSALAMKLCNLASLDPVIAASGRAGLPGASAADRAIWKEMSANWPAFATAAQEAVAALGATREIDETQRETPERDFTGMERAATRAERVGQDLFRDAVLTAYEHRCCITGLAIPELLVASHIVPWRSDPRNRLNPANGLCLSYLHDRAFDIGLISVRDDWTVAVSSTVSDAARDFWYRAIAVYEGYAISLPDKFQPSREFLARHRDEIFLQ